MTKHKTDLRTLTQEAEDAFWQVVGQHYPEAKAGDLSPWTSVRLSQVAEEAIAEWIWANVAQPRDPSAPTYSNESDGHTYWLNAEGDLVAAPTLIDRKVESESWIYADDFDEPLSDAERQRILNQLRGD